MNVSIECANTTGLSVRRGSSTARNEAEAVSELVSQIRQPQAAVAVVFASSRFDLDILGPSLKKAFGTCPVVGCTTAGEITPEGYAEGSLTGFTLDSNEIDVQSHLIADLRKLDGDRLRTISDTVRSRVSTFQKTHSGAKAFGLFLIDGLSLREEQTIAQVYRLLDGTPIVGGSAGDGFAYERTATLFDGAFRSNSAVLTVFTTTLPFRTFKTQHFEPTETKLVITESDPATRRVYEINGLPAAEEYARLIGVAPDKLDTTVFSECPLMLKIGGEYFVRSIGQANSDGSLTFFCAIDNGLVLTVAKGVDMVEHLERTFDRLNTGQTDPQIIITCECALRRLEVIRKGYSEGINRILRDNNAIGFHSYGEQYNSIHVNQTFTGIALGSRK